MPVPSPAQPAGLRARAAGKSLTLVEPVMERPPGGLTARQFVSSLKETIDKLGAGANAKYLDTVAAEELLDTAKMSADLKARYLVGLLDLAGARRQGAEIPVDELRRTRETFEEIDRGLDLLQRAVIEGTVKVRGVRAER